MGFVPAFEFFGNFFMWSVFLLAWAACLLYLVENSHAGWASFTVLVTLLFLQTCTDFHPFTLAYQHPTTALGYAVLFLISGIGVGIYKWWRFAVNLNHDYEENIDTMLLQNGKTFDQLSESEKNSYIDSAVRYVTNGNQFAYPLHLYQHKARITTWMTFWPIVGLWTLLKDPVRSFYIYAYQQISSTLQAIADRAQARVKPEYIRK
jgi:hypothetical protein